ncbi:MAG: nuclear transport factor 2 family protein [Pseudomonadales bacterium]|nr:nuclear transport factor 2 family protein [Pseudomonadales bacterium]
MATGFLRRSAALTGLLAALVIVSPAKASPQVEAEAVLDSLHRYASEAALEPYLGLFTEDGVFLGTDRSERWPMAEFAPYVAARFATGTGWTYHPAERQLAFSDDGTLAWFDEVVVGTRMGPCRGTGVLRKTAEGWRIAHYSLTLLVPNDLAQGVVDRIQAYEQEPAH